MKSSRPARGSAAAGHSAPTAISALTQPHALGRRHAHSCPLTDATRQANKRFFNSIDEVPEKAVSMGIKTVMQSRRIILMAFGKNKAQAVKGMIEGRIDNSVPASILQLHPDCTVYIDDDAASML